MDTTTLWKQEIFAWDEEHADMDVVTRDSLIMEKLFLERPIKPCPASRFFYDDIGGYDKNYGDCDGGFARELMRRRMKTRRPLADAEAGQELAVGVARRAYSGESDIGHTAPDFQNVFSLGLSGLLARLEKYAVGAQSEESRRYYEAGIRTWKAAIAYVKRAASAVENGEQAAALSALAERPPQTLYEAVQLTVLYYMLQHWFDGSAVRTLGRLDALYEPFRAADIAAGRLDDEGVYKMMEQLMDQLDGWRIRANIPFAIGGTGADGKTAVNAMSYIILKAYAAHKSPYVQLNFLYTEDMPRDLVAIVLDVVRNGADGICFMGDKTVTQSLINCGEKADEAREYAVVGCYECGGRGELTCSCTSRVNIPKAIEAVFGNGYDLTTGDLIGVVRKGEPETYEVFLERFFDNLKYFCDAAIRLTDARERQYAYTHSAPIFSATYDACVENGRDMYCHSGAKYCNSSLNAMGLATAADALYAVKKLVYEDRELTFSALAEILKNDWEGQEPLRLRVRNRFPKYGTGCREIDQTAAAIVESLSEYVNGRPNAKGGIYRLGMFSIDWRHMFGKETAATPDGRRRGETISQNSSASFGADREGVTAHILSVTEQDHTLTPNGSVLDIDFHSSAVRGEDGLAAMEAALRTYMRRGGFAVHYNVLNADVLREARESPEAYPNLQVRLCGWNARFANLKPHEQEEFIVRAEENA